MIKNIKYSASLFIILLLVLGYYTVQAEDNSLDIEKPVACTMDAKMCPDGTSVGRVAPDCKFAACPGERINPNEDRLRNKLGEIKNRVEEKKDEVKIKKEEVKIKIEDKKNELEKEKEEHKLEIQGLLDEVKTQREEHKAEFELKKEETKAKVEEIKAKFEEHFSKVKDENKKLTAETIVNKINELNAKLTEQLKNKIDQIENVLVSIESRIAKAKNNGIDVTSAEAQVEKAKVAINAARTTITGQAGKTYSVSTASDTTLKAEMKKLRDAFKTDMKAVNEKVKAAHVAVKTTATNLAKVPKIDDDSNEVESTTKVEESSTSDTTTTNPTQ